MVTPKGLGPTFRTPNPSKSSTPRESSTIATRKNGQVNKGTVTTTKFTR